MDAVGTSIVPEEEAKGLLRVTMPSGFLRIGPFLCDRESCDGRGFLQPVHSYSCCGIVQEPGKPNLAFSQFTLGE